MTRRDLSIEEKARRWDKLASHRRNYMRDYWRRPEVRARYQYRRKLFEAGMSVEEVRRLVDEAFPRSPRSGH